MKKVLIVIHDMRIGGAQKSLVSFLQCLTASQMGKEYEISLMVIDPQGAFMKQIPESVKLIAPPKPLRWLGSAFGKDLLLHHFSFGSLWGECCWLVQKKLKQMPKSYNLQQKLWHSWKNRIPAYGTKYDIAVSYMDGVPNYYVMDKVSAHRKILWVHSEYAKQGYYRDFDRQFFDKANGIITISQNCKCCLDGEFPAQADKIHVLENMTDPNVVIQRSREGAAPEFERFAGVKLLTVARLNPQKGVDLAAEAACLMKKQGLPFLWLVVGDGPERDYLCQKVQELGISECFVLLGSRENPYGYMAACDILVQPSRVEGKSIVLDEAKILEKPIVSTNYATVGDSLTHAETGWIVDMTAQAISEGIMRLWKDISLRQQISNRLKAVPKSKETLLQQYIEVMFE